MGQGKNGHTFIYAPTPIVTKEFFPERGFGKMRLSVARKAVNDFNKLSNNPVEITDIMLHYVEQGALFTAEYGEIDEPFYNSMEGMYGDALRFIFKNSLIDSFRDRCEEIIEDATEGWGFRDGLRALYEIEILERFG